jgi:hypothetical protein
MRVVSENASQIQICSVREMLDLGVSEKFGIWCELSFDGSMTKWANKKQIR